MVKVIRVSKIELNNEFETNKSSSNDQSVVKVFQRHPSNSISSIYTDGKRYSVTVQSLPHHRSKIVAPEHFEGNQRIPKQRSTIYHNSTATNKTNRWNFSTNRISHVHGEKSRNHQRRRGVFPWWKLCCCCLSCAALLLIGLIAAIIALFVVKHSETATSVATTVAVFNSTTTTISTSVTTTAITVSTISAAVTTTTSTTVSISFTTTVAPTTSTTTIAPTTSTTTIAPTTLTTTIAPTTSTTTVVPTTSTTTGISTSNWLINGDGETGPCQSGSGITHPTGWSYSGNITQAYYTNSAANQNPTDPGPSNRGQCHFYGQISSTTSMWQTVNMTNTINPVLIDNQTVYFNFSAWIGGYVGQDDNAQATLTFLDQSNHGVGSNYTLGPVLAAARSSITSLLFRQTTGLVPIGARLFTVTVTITRLSGTYNDGDIDNIALYLHQ